MKTTLEDTDLSRSAITAHVVIFFVLLVALAVSIDFYRLFCVISWFNAMDYIDSLFENPFPVNRILLSPALSISRGVQKLFGCEAGEGLARWHIFIGNVVAIIGQVALMSGIATSLIQKLIWPGASDSDGKLLRSLKPSARALGEATRATRIAPLYVRIPIIILAGFASGLIVWHSPMWIVPRNVIPLMIMSVVLVSVALLTLSYFFVTVGCITNKVKVVFCDKELGRYLVFIVLACAFSVAGIFGAVEIKSAQCRVVCRKLNPIFDTLQEHREQYGSYPANINDIAGLDALLNETGVSLAQGEYVGTNGIYLKATMQADAALYLDKDRYQCNVLIRKVRRPITRSFYVYMRLSDEEEWMHHVIRTRLY